MLVKRTYPAISCVAVRCTVEPLFHAAPQCVPKPEGDTYKFTHFAHKLMVSKGINPLLSDSRRRKDRLALQVRLGVAALYTAIAGFPFSMYCSHCESLFPAGSDASSHSRLSCPTTA